MNKVMKRFLAFLLIGVLAVSCFTGCSQTNDTQDNSTGKTSSSSESIKGPITKDPITISILTTRQTTATNDAKDLWFFKYLEWWMKEKGYNVKIQVQQTKETDQQISLLLGTDSLPDLIWGIPLSNSNAVTFGAEEGMILDWTPYLNEKTMPNLTNLLKDNQDALVASTCNDDGIYGLPYLVDRGWGQAAGNMPADTHVYINKNWLEKCNLKVPATIDGFIDMLRAFKNNIKPNDGKEVIPLVNNGDLLEKYLWACLGYYGNGLDKYGFNLQIKNGEVWLPAATEDYRTFIKIMNTLYKEGLISKDYFTMDTTTARGLMSSGVCGVLGDYGLQTTQSKTFADWTSVLPMAIGNNTKVCAASVSTTYQVSKIWASSSTKYPEVLAMLLDYVYSEEGSVLYYYGPQEGKDPLNTLSGWYFDEKGVITSKDLGKTTYGDLMTWAGQYVYPTLYTANAIDYTRYSKKLVGLDSTMKTDTYTDAITGKPVEVVWKVDYKDDNADGYMRVDTVAAWESASTTVRLPAVYMSSEDSKRTLELETVLRNYINSESAKFITGLRPLNEIDTFYNEFKKMGADKYLELYRKAYSNYMKSISK